MQDVENVAWKVYIIETHTSHITREGRFTPMLPIV